MQASSFLEDRIGPLPWEAASPQDVLAYCASLRSAGRGHSTVLARTAAMRGLYRYLGWMGRISPPYPTDLGRGARPAPFRLPRVLSRDQAEELCEAPDQGPLGVRDRLVLELLYGSGLRASEVCLARVLDYDPGSRVLDVRGKGYRHRSRAPVSRRVPVNRHTDSLIHAYAYPVRGPRALARGGGAVRELVLNRSGRPCRTSTIRSIVSRYGRVIGVQDLTPHVLRATFATHMIEGGADLRVVQELLGHAWVTTTTRYLALSQEHITAQYLSAHPRARGEEASL